MPSNTHSAAGPSAGYVFQFDRAVYWLSKSPAGSIIGIETDDDVAVIESDGSLRLEQDKHSIQDKAEPFGDRSKDLWNTLAIWLDAIESDQVQVASAAFYMVTNKSLRECIAKRIGDASSEAEIAASISALEQAGSDPPQAISGLSIRVLRAESRAMLGSLIAKIRLCDGSDGTAGAALRQKTIAELQLPTWCAPLADSIADELSGWLLKTVLALWQSNKPAWVKRDDFVNQLHAILSFRHRQMTRERAEHLIPITEDHIGKEKGRPFVKQLHLITEDDTVVDTSIREYIRCNIEKSRLSKEGNITDADWEAFECQLLSRWGKIRARVVRMKTHSPDEEIGFEVFTETTEDHREKLAGTDTEQVYLTSGTYHRLADLLRVGWHPHYEALMQEYLKTS